MRKGGRNLPVDICLPDGIVQAVEDVQEHVSDISLVGPILEILWCPESDISTVVSLGERVTSSPDDHGKPKEHDQASLGSQATGVFLKIEDVSNAEGTGDLGEVVEKGVKGLGAGVEVGTVDGVEMVGVEPIRGEEHGEEEDDKWLELDRLDETHQLGLPGGVLHEDNS